MSGTDHQQAVDIAHNCWVNAEDASSSHAAEVTRDAISRYAGLHIYCPQHLGNHLLGVQDLEKLIYGLVGDRADIRMDGVQGTDEQRYDSAHEETYSWCPLDDLHWMQDGETYDEHIRAFVESRQDGRLMNLPTERPIEDVQLPEPAEA